MTRLVVTADRKEALVRSTGYSWSGLYGLARRAGVSLALATDEQVRELVRSHVLVERAPAPITYRYDRLGRLRRAR